MESAIALVFFLTLILLTIGLVVQMQADFVSFSNEVQKVLAIERERAKENAIMEWRGRYDVLLSNIGTNTSIKFIYIYLNGSKAPNYVVDVKDLVAIINESIKPHYFADGLLLGPNVKVRLNLEQFGDWRILYNLERLEAGDTSGLLPVMIPSASDPGSYYFEDERFLNVTWLDLGPHGYALFRKKMAGATTFKPEVRFDFGDGKEWTVCFWLKIKDPASSSKWTVLDVDTFKAMIDSTDIEKPKLFFRVGNDYLEQGSDYVNATEWHHYCLVTSEGESNKAVLRLYVDGRSVKEIASNVGDPSPQYLQLPNPQDLKAGVVAYDDIFIANKALDEEDISRLAKNRVFEPMGANYLYFSFEKLKNEVTRVDLVSEMGVVFTSSPPQKLLPG